MKNLQSESYDIQGLVQYFGRPGLETERKMIKFLQMTGVLNGMEPNPLLKRRRFIWLETTSINRGYRSKAVQKVMFNKYGREWVDGLAALYLSEEVDHAKESEFTDRLY
ncbi:hypothetical protein [Dyadobacter sp. MSC1_007]|jgi:hypothetical protein|uniref:hypothetical protein n=1 Tax=Dyadobacter sp. MSC1_007 TaxID=2909264 RepID=UPI00202E467D|nr:hypothetical protein [Dyadobacter sp. MSC1_007]